MTKKKAALFCNNSEQLEKVYSHGRKEDLDQLVELYPAIISEDNISAHLQELAGIEVIFSTWGMPALDQEIIQQLPNLKAVFYAAGSVKGFAEPFLKENIQVFSAWAANAIPVAEFSMAQILLSCKRYFLNQQACKTPSNRANAPRGNGNFTEKVAIIGGGMIGRKVIELLQPFELDILLVDPYIDPVDANAMNVSIATLEDAFKQAYVVSNHLPNIPATVGILNGKCFSSMREGATFINTGRGAQVNESEMINAFKQRPDLTALLDVTYPEPPLDDSEFYTLSNVFLSSHIAGSLGNEVVRMADYMIMEFKNWEQGIETQYEVTIDMLDKLA